MSGNDLLLREIIVVCSALIYWSGVLIHACRIRRNIGKPPNVKPSGLRENILWLGWFVVIAGWTGQPFIIKNHSNAFFFSCINVLHHHGIIFGALIALLGHAGTLWCYAVLGDSWRIGINRKERTPLIMSGPYKFLRHPIYLFQIIILIGMVFLLPTPFSFMILLIHIACVVMKALDEEAYLNKIHGNEYRTYLSRTGMFLPRMNTLFEFFQRQGKSK
ncbi:MAG: isoprenylcysteine carboxylmethyltransferase family protein [Thermodesulfovibrionales bacterium]